MGDAAEGVRVMVPPRRYSAESIAILLHSRDPASATDGQLCRDAEGGHRLASWPQADVPRTGAGSANCRAACRGDRRRRAETAEAHVKRNRYPQNCAVICRILRMSSDACPGTRADFPCKPLKTAAERFRPLAGRLDRQKPVSVVWSHLERRNRHAPGLAVVAASTGGRDLLTSPIYGEKKRHRAAAGRVRQSGLRGDAGRPDRAARVSHRRTSPRTSDLLRPQWRRYGPR